MTMSMKVMVMTKKKMMINENNIKKNDETNKPPMEEEEEEEKIYETAMDAINDLHFMKPKKRKTKEELEEIKKTCTHDDITFGVVVRPAQLIACRNCETFLCWIIGGFCGKFIHKSIKEIWEDYEMEPFYDEGVLPEVYTFTPIKTKSTENDEDDE